MLLESCLVKGKCFFAKSRALDALAKPMKSLARRVIDAASPFIMYMCFSSTFGRNYFGAGPHPAHNA